MMVKRWSAFLALLMAIPLAFIAASAPSANAAASAGCPTAELIGLHGTGEGPSPTEKKKKDESPTIKTTFADFQKDAGKLGKSGEQTIWDDYPTISPSDYGSIKGLHDALKTIGQTAGSLEAYMEEVSFICPQTPISLVGYSVGAWIINVTLDLYTQEYPYIKAVLYYGDPCWYNPDGPYRGLARYAQLIGFHYDCVPYRGYPYPQGSTFPVQSLCNDKDPICGQGWPWSDIVDQFKAAKNCLKDKCTHLDYTSDGAVTEGAEFLAENAFAPVGGVG